MKDKDNLKDTSKVVMTCYSILDVALAGSVKDFTDGKYYGDSSLPYDKAQVNQAEWLLDQIKCTEGSYILDIGCGNGRLLQAAKKRGAKSVGITISDVQVKKARKKGLDTIVMNYRNIPESWNGRFDGVIANGSVEHFVQVQDAINGKQDDIYEQMFKIVHRILKPGGYFATTIIHFNQPVDPREIIKGSKAFKKGSDNYQFAKVLLEDFGGWYPREDQLEQCTRNNFTLLNREDGTEDYNWTSEYWLRELYKQIPRNPKVWLALLRVIVKHPISSLRMLENLLFDQSWMWQFRERERKGTPTRLYRDVWKRIER